MGPKLAYEEVAGRLRKMIIAGQVRSDGHLPSELELSRQFGVGRSTLREALRMLSSQGFLTTSRGVGGGSIIANMSHDTVTSMLEMALHLLSRSEGVAVTELLEARELLEVPAARLAAARRSERQLALIRETIPKSLRGMSAQRIFEVNHGFHEALLDASQNRLLHAMTEPIFRVIARRFSRARSRQKFRRMVIQDHKAILRVIEIGDANAAAEEMHLHLQRLRSTYEAVDSLSTTDTRRANLARVELLTAKSAVG